MGEAHEATPKFHENRFGEVSEEVRLFSAMVVLWGTEQFGQTLNQLFAGKKKEEVVLAARMLSFYTAHKINLEQARSSKAKRKARILVTLDQNTTCSACKKDSDQEYSLERVPELPHPDCQCAIGCRCGAIFVRTGGLFSE
ncbi:hypothetical protein [Shimia thalassica]|uniref:hypothetical protein n=1 Tax=Shimia thalassica TaxID=1715693 RepID=UPI0026E3F602|nr:hypothetical protein [Shimia thalassica]MDO6799895.1 hypothetical protein [Shimia thalassica]